MENKFITIDFPNKLLRYELKEYLEYNFKVYIKKEEDSNFNYITVFGSPCDLNLCQEQANYFKSVDSQFLLHLNEYSNEALNIPSLKLLLESKCKILMCIDSNVLYIFGQLYNTTCLYNFLCKYTNMIERDDDFQFYDTDETNLNVICRKLNINLPNPLLKKTKIFIYFILKHREELFVQVGELHLEMDELQVEVKDLPIKLDKVNIVNVQIVQNISKSQENIKYMAENCSSDIKLNEDHSRTIIIDGSDVAFEHGKNGNQMNFSSIGIKIAVKYFVNRGHSRVFAIVPRYRQPAVCDEIQSSNYLKYSPSRINNNVRETSSDSHFVLDAAIECDGVVISNKSYRNLMQINKYKEFIKKRLIPYSFIGDHFIVPDDPFGKYGPPINEILAPANKNVKKSPKKQAQLPNPLKKYQPPSSHSKAINTPKPSQQNKTLKSELKGHQIDLYRQAFDVFPVYGDVITSIILGNPEITDLNTIINFVIMATNKK